MSIQNKAFRFLRITRTIALVLTVVMLSVTSLAINPAPTLAQEDFSKLDATIQALMKDYLVPGVSLAIIKNDKVAYTQGYGYAKLEEKTPVTPETVFAIGSISKSFTSLAVMQLVEQGKVDLDAPVIKYLPEFKMPNPYYSNLVKVRHLISHSTGLPRADVELYNPDLKTAEDVLRSITTLTATGRPGEVYAYSNQNFVIAGLLIKAVTGQTWEDYVREHIFKPLGMNQSSFALDGLQQSMVYALPYQWDVLRNFASVPVQSRDAELLHIIGPAGSINANMVDMINYTLMQLGKGTQLVSPKTLALMHTGQIDMESIPGLLTTQNRYAFGWVDQYYREKHIIFHNGSYTGWLASLTLVPDSGDAIILMTNTSNADAFTQVVRFTILEQLYGMSPTPDLESKITSVYLPFLATYKDLAAQAKAYKPTQDELKAFAGNYTGIIGDFSVAFEDGTLYLVMSQTPDPQKVAVYLYAKNEFILNDGLASAFTIKPDADGILTIYAEGQVAGHRID